MSVTPDIDEWGVGRLDVEAYLGRIGHAGGLAPTAGTLASHARH